MQKYIISIACVAIITAFCDILAPKGWGRYVGVVSGAMLASAVAAPVSVRLDIDKFQPPPIECREFDVEAIKKAELEKRVEEDISLRIKSEFNQTATADVELDVADGGISGVKSIVLYCDEKEKIKNRMNEVYGCEDVQFRKSVAR